MNELHPYSFQADSEIVKRAYIEESNYIIEYNHKVNPEYCAVYFSSNDLYYPNTELAFKEMALNNNRFEWYKNRISYVYKHIFFRDLLKQWYLTGINYVINDPKKISEFIDSESQGYKLILVGSSAGGFIATILGQLLNADRIYSFNGQFEILSLLKHPNANILNPILFREFSNVQKLIYYDSLNFITNPSSIYYFHSCQNSWDIQQSNHLGNLKINRISFRTSNHGIPFLKSNLSTVLNLSLDNLNKMSGKTYHPLLFSIKMVGIQKTIQGISSIINFAINKIYIQTVLKWKKK